MKKLYNEKWKFVIDKKKDISNYTLKDILRHKSKNITLPHTFNNLDGQDGGGNYYRGVVFYYKKIDIKDQKKITYLEFEGVNSICDVYLDDELVGHNEGGYHTFRVNLTQKIENKKYIVIKVDNRENEYVYPKLADFTFFGGIYRDVHLIQVESCHFDLDYYGSCGVKVTSSVNLDSLCGKIDVKCFVKDFENAKIDVNVFANDIKMSSYTFDKTEFEIDLENVSLWSPSSPNIYTLLIDLIKDGVVVDQRKIDTAFRKYEVKSDGFYLNGINYPLRGVSRHQDRLNKGWALSANDHIEDMKLIKELGANSIRLAHYEHAPLIYSLADRLGLVVWCEVPYISSALVYGEENILSQMKHLVIQTYNNPSVMIIGLSNEITIASGNINLYDTHEKLNSLVKEIAKEKLTVIANLSMVEKDNSLNEIPDLVSYNHYFGWYMGDVSEYKSWYSEYGKLCGLSEYGCEANIKIHSNDPKQSDYSEEYQAYYHEQVIKQLYENKKVWCMYVWNMFDFASDNRDEGGCKGRNNKGLVTFDRKIKKDSFYIYKAYLNKNDKFIHINKRRFKYQDTNILQLKIYSNLEEVDIYVNKKYYETAKVNKVYEFKVKLDKVSIVEAYSKDKKIYDKVKFIYNPNKAKQYVLKNQEDVVNWFNDSTFKIDPNYFSIKDKLKDIVSTKQGKEYIDSLFEKLSKDANIPNGILKIVYNFTIERISQMAKSHFPKEVIIEINNNLQKIKK